MSDPDLSLGSPNDLDHRHEIDLAAETERLKGEITYLKTLIAEALDEIQRMKLERTNERFEPTA